MYIRILYLIIIPCCLFCFIAGGYHNWGLACQNTYYKLNSKGFVLACIYQAIFFNHTITRIIVNANISTNYKKNIMLIFPDTKFLSEILDVYVLRFQYLMQTDCSKTSIICQNMCACTFVVWKIKSPSYQLWKLMTLFIFYVLYLCFS